MTIDEQIELLIKKSTSGNSVAVTRIHLESKEFRAILASLERLKRIDDVQVPDEPIELVGYREALKTGWKPFGVPVLAVFAKHIDTLRDLLKEEKANGVAWENTSQHWQSRAEAAEATIAAMLKLGEEPSEEMRKIAAGILNISTVKTCADGIALFSVLFAKLIEQAGVKK